MGFWSGLKSVGGGIAGGIKKITGMDDPGADAERMRKAMLEKQAAAAGGFADTAQQGYGQLGGEAATQRDYLGRLSRGEESLSAEQLRQGLQQNQAAQMSMAAGANPQNAASTARLGAILASRQASGMSGAAAIAGIQERQAAHQALANMIMQQRGQDLNAALGSRQTAVSGYGAGMQGQPEKSWLEKYGPVIRDTASFAAGGGKPA